MRKTSIDYKNAMGNRYKEIVYEKVGYDASKVTLEGINIISKNFETILAKLKSSI